MRQWAQSFRRRVLDASAKGRVCPLATGHSPLATAFLIASENIKTRLNPRRISRISFLTANGAPARIVPNGATRRRNPPQRRPGTPPQAVRISNRHSRRLESCANPCASTASRFLIGAHTSPTDAAGFAQAPSPHPGLGTFCAVPAYLGLKRPRSAASCGNGECA
jgi:hypothetical protein